MQCVTLPLWGSAVETEQVRWHQALDPGMPLPHARLPWDLVSAHTACWVPSSGCFTLPFTSCQTGWSSCLRGCVKLPGADRLEAPRKPDRREVLLLAHTWASHLPRLQAPAYRRPQRVPVYHPQPSCPDSAPSSPACRPGGPTTRHSEATVPG